MGTEEKLTALEIEGFQSISDRARIELNTITLLYGPNSAGKSSVSDAIEFLKEVSAHQPNWDQIKQMVDRWASHNHSEENISYQRRREASGFKEDLFRTLRLAVEYEFNFEDPDDDPETYSLRPGRWPKLGGWGRVDKDQNDPLSRDWPNCKARIEIAISTDGTNELDSSIVFNHLKILVSNRPLIEISNTGDWDPMGEDTVIDFYDSWLFPFISDYTYVNALNKDKDPFRNKRSKVDGSDVYRLQIRPVHRLNVLEHAYDDWPTGAAEEALDVTSEVVKYFFYNLNHLLKIGPPIVSADRTIPYSERNLSNVDLKYTKYWWPDTESSATAPLKNLVSQIASKDFYVSALAELAHCYEIRNALNSDEWGSDYAKQKLTNHRAVDFQAKASQLDQLNKYLSEDLFYDRLYQLRGSSILMVPLDTTVEDPYHSHYILSQPALTSLFLLDGKGNRVELRDVGSGIPFVLPVLLSVLSPGLKFLQQPELHLHPALQSSLADIFIRQSKTVTGSTIIETHSEHLLLRLLRRIRDTTNKKVLDESLSFSADNISVYYFDPKLSGETVVIKMLVSDVGDFKNRWPKGFFDERATDLFDE